MENEPIDVFYDMDIAQICQHFSKSRNTVDKAVAKLVKDYPDKDWKYKNPETKRITIKAEGIEKLSSYFRKEKHEISTVEMELRYENEKLTAILEEKDKAIAKMEFLYNERLKLELEKTKQTYLLEDSAKAQEIAELKSENQKLLSQLKNEDIAAHTLEETKDKVSDLEQQLERYKNKEQEYNSKSMFYRLTHRFSIS